VALSLIAVGGAAGALTRYSAGLVWPHEPGAFATGDFVSNLAGCLAMGLFLGVVSMLASTPEALTLLIATGYLGGLTTFSSYAADTVTMVESGGFITAALYVATTVLFGWFLLRLGWLVGRRGAGASAGRPEFGPEEMGD
jgi:CrcB protein